jgi:hypothetical protein
VDAGTPVVQVSDDLIDLRFANEHSVVQTVFATTTLMLLRASLGKPVEPVAAAAEADLARPVLDLDAEQYTFVGQGGCTASPGRRP